jgi:deltex-like protein
MLSRPVCGGAMVSRLRYTAPKRHLTAGVPSNAVTAPPASCNMEQECSICYDRLNKRSCVALSTCHHVFHTDCMQRAFKFTPECPICRHPMVGATQGKSPPGTMAVSILSSRCSGFQCGSFCITYTIPAGYQRSYHDNPGRKHGGKSATAYLPHNEEGKDVLKRLQFAFKHGLSFAVGTSVTTGLVDQCVW